MPSEPAPVSRPSAFRSENFVATSIGMSSPPSARMVTPDPPVNVVKKAHTSAVTMAGPPRIWPNQAMNTRSSRRDAPLSARKHRLDPPARNVIRQAAAHLALSDDELHGRAAEHDRGGGGNNTAEKRRGSFPPAREKLGQAGQRKQSILPCRDGSTEHAREEREMTEELLRALDPDRHSHPAEHFRNREQDHRDEDRDQQEILPLMQPAQPSDSTPSALHRDRSARGHQGIGIGHKVFRHGVEPRFARYSASVATTASNISAGTIAPRSLG